MAQHKSIIDTLKCRLRRHFNSRQKGAYYEDKACQYLKKQRLQFIIKNFRCYGGEIDLIMRDQDELVFVEVRYRQYSYYSSSLESVDDLKQQRIKKAAEYYLQSIQQNEHPCRFDIIGFDSDHLSWIKDAF